MSLPDNAGKLAVSPVHRGKGLARLLIQQAEKQAAELGHAMIELQARIELAENHAAFAKMGFMKTAEGRHEGFTQPTEITMQKQI